MCVYVRTYLLQELPIEGKCGGKLNFPREMPDQRSVQSRGYLHIRVQDIVISPFTSHHFLIFVFSSSHFFKGTFQRDGSG